MSLSPRFTAALAYASELHGTQLRKGTDVPYVSHLLAVAAIVLEYAGTEDDAIAALLHDAVEDQGGVPVLDHIRARFGGQVAATVAACSEPSGDPKPPWRERKDAYIVSIADKDPSALLVTSADKLHNARAILRDHRCVGEAVWDRFAAGREGSLWYYRAVTDALKGKAPARLWQELDAVVTDLEAAADNQSDANPLGGSGYGVPHLHRENFAAAQAGLAAVASARARCAASGQLHQVTILNLAQFAFLWSLDLNIEIGEVHRATEGWTKRLHARLLALLVVEAMEDFGELLGREFRDAMTALSPGAQATASLRAVGRRLAALRGEHEKDLRAVRNRLIGHREKNAQAQMEALAALDPEAIASVAWEMLSWTSALYEALNLFFPANGQKGT